VQAAHRRRGQQVCPRATLNVEAVKDVAGLVLFSALPFVAVQALADSQYGKELLENVNAQKPVLQKQAQQREEERRRARQQRCGASTLCCSPLVPVRCVPDVLPCVLHHAARGLAMSAPCGWDR
jgi:hypothetical protein